MWHNVRIRTWDPCGRRTRSRRSRREQPGGDSPKPLPIKFFHRKRLRYLRPALRLHLHTGMKNVLIADDDLSVLALIARALPEYRIIAARNGFEALALASQLADCDLLITDYLMPMMTGDELAGRLRAARPTVKTLLVTGHTAFVDTRSCGTDAHLSKPFRPGELREAVASLIGGS